MSRAQIAAAKHKRELEKLLGISLALEKKRFISIPPGILLPFFLRIDILASGALSLSE